MCFLIDSDPSEESVSAHTSAKGPHENPTTADVPLPSPDTPPANETPPAPRVSHKKTGRGQARRGRVGRNQYTKDREVQATTSHSHSHSRNASLLEAQDHDTPLGRRRSRSRSVMNDSRNYPMGANGHAHSYVNGTNLSGASVWGESGKPSKPKHLNLNRTSLNEMKRRVAGILEFISRTQLEFALAESSPKLKSGSQTPSPQQQMSPPKGVPGAPPRGLALEGLDHVLDGADGGGGESGSGSEGSSSGGGSDKDNKGKESSYSHGSGNVNGANNGNGNGTSGGGGGTPIPDLLTVKEEDFRCLSSAEMMRVLTGHLEGWQKEFGRWGEK